MRKTVRHERGDALWFSFSTYIPISVCNITQCSEAIQIVLLLAESDCVHSNVVIHLGFERSSQIHTQSLPFTLLCSLGDPLCGRSVGTATGAPLCCPATVATRKVSLRTLHCPRVHAPSRKPRAGLQKACLHTGITHSARVALCVASSGQSNTR